MKLQTMSAVLLTLVCTAPAIAADDSGAHVGEVRLFAVAHDDRSAAADLQRDGWVEANGQLLEVARYPDLYRRIGRTWTADGVAADRFAVPRLSDVTQRRRSSDNPFGVLGPGDLVTSGRPRPVTSRRHPLSYWIFTGSHASAEAAKAARPQQ